MAGESADVSLELSVRVKDMTAQALARIGKTAADAGAQMQAAFTVADKAAKTAVGSSERANVAFTQTATVLPRVSDGFRRADVAAKGFGTSLGVIGSLLRRSPLLILADFASRVAGFNGVMDIFNKTMNAAADSVRTLIGLAPAHADALDKETSAVEKLNAAYEDVLERRRGTVAGGFGFNLEGRFGGTFLDEAVVALKQFDEAVRDVAGPGERIALFAELNEQLAELEVRQSEHKRQLEDTAKATRESAKAVEDWNKALARGEAIERRRDAIVAMSAAARPLVALMRELAVVEAVAAQARARQAAFADDLSRGEAIERRRESMERLVAAAQPLVRIMRDLAVLEAGQSVKATQFLAEETARLAEEQRLLGIEVEKATGFLDDQNRLRQQQRESTFGFGFGQVLDDLKDINRFLGAQIAGGAFEGLRTLFRDVATDTKKASEALKEFGRNFLTMIADIFAQKAAAGILTGLFGGTFLDGATENEKGGVMYGAKLASLPIRAYSGGGIANSPQVAIYGEGKAGQFGEAFVPLSGNRRIPVELRGGGGGGTTLHATFQVNSLDPSTAASVILSNMDLIGRGITSMLQGGHDRALRTAVRTA